MLFRRLLRLFRKLLRLLLQRANTLIECLEGMPERHPFFFIFTSIILWI